MIKKTPQILFLSLLLIHISCISIHAQNKSLRVDSPKSPNIVDTLGRNTDTLSIKVSSKSNDIKIVLIDKNEKSDWKGDLLKYIVPVLTLLLGIVINRALDRYKDKKKTIEVGERWIAELRAWQEPIQQQIEQLDELISTHQEDSYDLPELVVVTGMDGEVFKSLDKSELLQFIKRKYPKNTDTENIKISNSTHGLVNIFANLHEALKSKFNDYLNGRSKYIAEVNENLQKLTAAFNKYGVELEKEFGGDPVSHSHHYKVMFELFLNHLYNENRAGIFELKEVFFLPLIAILGELRTDERTESIGAYTRSCLHNIKGLEMENKYWKENMILITERYKEHVASISIIADRIENKGTKEIKSIKKTA